MFTILWRIDADHEVLYSAIGLAKIPAASPKADDPDCGGRPHVSFQCFIAVENSDKPIIHRQVIDSGEVFVMNAEGKTVATYRFPQIASGQRIAA